MTQNSSSIDLSQPLESGCRVTRLFEHLPGLRAQGFNQAIARTGNAREDWRILAEMAAAAGTEAPGSLKALRMAVAEALFPGTDLDRLAAEAQAATTADPEVTHG